MYEKVTIAGQERFVTRPDEHGIPTEMPIDCPDIVVQVGGQIVSSTKRRQVDPCLDQGTSSKAISGLNQKSPSRWERPERPAGGRRLIG
jgi:hypothetical protein